MGFKARLKDVLCIKCLLCESKLGMLILLKYGGSVVRHPIKFSWDPTISILCYEKRRNLFFIARDHRYEICYIKYSEHAPKILLSSADKKNLLFLIKLKKTSNLRKFSWENKHAPLPNISLHNILPNLVQRNKRKFTENRE